MDEPAGREPHEADPASRPRRRIATPEAAGDDLTQVVPRVAPPRVQPPAKGSAAEGSTAVWPTATRPTERIDVAKPAPLPEPGHSLAKATPPPRRWWRVALLALAALAAVGAAIVVGTRSVRPEQDSTGGVATATPDAKHPPQKDAALDGCKLDASGVAANGTVRNPTDEPADYVIEVHLVDPAGVVITTGRSTTRVPAGERTSWSATLPPTASNAPSATCKIVQVDRYDAP